VPWPAFAGFRSRSLYLFSLLKSHCWLTYLLWWLTLDQQVEASQRVKQWRIIVADVCLVVYFVIVTVSVVDMATRLRRSEVATIIAR
jgi:hypothetical protein